MDLLFPALDNAQIVLTLAVVLASGIVKGVVGFAMPMIMVSLLGTFLDPELALAGLILPTLVSNGIQGLRQGLAAAIASIVRFRVFLLAGLVLLVISAQLVRVLPPQAMMLLIGLPVTVFAGLQLAGVSLQLRRAPRRRTEAAIGAAAGFIGGFSGVWGPPTVAYLMALNTEKTEQIRIQGVIYGLAAVAMFLAHIGSGVIRAETAPFSAVLVVPAVVGMWLGGKIQDRIDQRAFRRATLAVLLIAGLNLMRRALLG